MVRDFQCDLVMLLDGDSVFTDRASTRLPTNLETIENADCCEFFQYVNNWISTLL